MFPPRLPKMLASNASALEKESALEQPPHFLIGHFSHGFRQIFRAVLRTLTLLNRAVAGAVRDGADLGRLALPVEEGAP